MGSQFLKSFNKNLRKNNLKNKKNYLFCIWLIFFTICIIKTFDSFFKSTFNRAHKNGLNFMFFQMYWITRQHLFKMTWILQRNVKKKIIYKNKTIIKTRKNNQSRREHNLSENGERGIFVFSTRLSSVEVGGFLVQLRVVFFFFFQTKRIQNKKTAALFHLPMSQFPFLFFYFI